MGLTIAEYPVYGGASTVNAYVNIRDIRHNKNEGEYKLSGFAKIMTTNDVFITALYIELTSNAVFTDTWGSLYIELKRILVEKGIVFINA
tara:strand:+ start:195 stop:464 length:270 start_codon:yes stop_codon:yes gene_type:complete